MRKVGQLWNIILIALFVTFPNMAGRRQDLDRDHSTSVVEIAVKAQVLSESTGKAVASLSHRDFILSEDGIHQIITRFERPSLPLSLLLLVDLTDTVSNRDFVNSQLNLWKSNLDRYMTGKDQVGLMLIRDDSIIVQGLSSDAQRIKNAIDELSRMKRSGMISQKNLESAIHMAIEQMRGQASLPVNQAVVLISTMPQKTASAIEFSKGLRDELLSSGIVFSWSTDAKAPNSVYKEDSSLSQVSLLDLISVSGGEFVESTWAQFLGRLRSPYVITYMPSRWPPQEGELRHIHLELVPEVGVKRDFRLIYHRAYVYRKM